MSRRQRLLLVTNRFHPQVGGAEFNIFLQAQELGKHFDVDVFTPLRDRDPRKETVERIRIQRGVNVRNLARRYPDLKAETLCPAIFTQALLRRYDVIHCFPSLSRNTILALMGARLRGAPVFMSMFDLDEYGALLARGQSLSEIFENQRSMAGKWRYFLQKFSAIFTISTRETENIRMSNENTFLSTVPILIDEYERDVDVVAFKRRYQVPLDVPLILSLGRVVHIKGQDVLVKALPRLREVCDRFHVLIVGRTDYEPEYVRDMKDFVAQNGLEKHVTFTDVVPREDVIGALKSCDVHVLPVRFMNSGAVVVETWAARKPVLQSNMIDPNYVVEGENGYTFDIDNQEQLCARLAELIENPSLRQSMGEKGRQLVEQKFLYPHLIRQYMEAYENFGGVRCL